MYFWWSVCVLASKVKVAVVESGSLLLCPMSVESDAIGSLCLLLCYLYLYVFFTPPTIRPPPTERSTCDFQRFRCSRESETSTDVPAQMLTRKKWGEKKKNPHLFRPVVEQLWPLLLYEVGLLLPGYGALTCELRLIHHAELPLPSPIPQPWGSLGHHRWLHN